MVPSGNQLFDNLRLYAFLNRPFALQGDLKMAEINYVIDETKDNDVCFLSTNIKSPMEGTKLRLYIEKIPIPQSTEELNKTIEKRFGEGFGLEYALEQFLIAGVCTKPAYAKTQSDNSNVTDMAQMRRLCQETLDTWKPGRKSAGPKVKKEDVQATKEAQNMAAALGLSLQELVALAAQLKK